MKRWHQSVLDRVPVGLTRLRILAASAHRSLSAVLQQGVAKGPRLTLRTRLLLVLVTVAAATTAVTVLLQESSLSSDLEQAARTRLVGASEVANQLIDEHLGGQVERYRAISSTPQFLANLESRHVQTLEYFADELANRQGAAAVLFLDDACREVATGGDRSMGAWILQELQRHPPTKEPVRFLASHGSVPYSLVCLPLRDQSQSYGRLAAVEPIRGPQLDSWSRLCRARVTVGPAAPDSDLSQPLRAAGALQLWVGTSLEDEEHALSNSRWRLITGGVFGLLLVSVASVWLARSLVRPILAIRSATERIGQGDLEFRLDAARSDEVGDVARAFNSMLDRLEDSIRERARVEDQIRHMAYHDDLTGLGNRQLLGEQLTQVLAQSAESRHSTAVFCLDLDRFKDVNDTLGHTAGDELLKVVAHRLTSSTRSLASGPSARAETPLLTRIGGDEFVLVLTGVQDRAQVERLAERALQSLAQPFKLRGQEVTLSASMGIALYPDDADDAETLLSNADMAMFHAKDRGGKGHEFYTDWMHEIVARRLTLESRLNRALEAGELVLYYQPKLNLHTNQVTGVEALIRWVTEDGVIGAGEFIPLAEETGAILEIGAWALREAAEQAIRWQDEGLPPVRIAVNVSARQLEQRADLVQYVADLLDETGLEPELLELEITESVLLNNEEATRFLLERFRELGVGLALDDFGTGYSSLSYLRQLPVDTLKIDRSFIQGAEQNAEDAALVGSIVAMAKVLDLRVVVEGVETRKQRLFLEGLGCDEIQGFLFARPVPADEAAAILRKKRRRRTARTSRATTAPRHSKARSPRAKPKRRRTV